MLMMGLLGVMTVMMMVLVLDELECAYVARVVVVYHSLMFVEMLFVVC